MSADDGFFRHEAVAAARSNEGTPVGNVGIGAWPIICLMALILICAAVFVLTAQYAKKEVVYGEILPADGVERLAAMHGGLVKKVWISSGQKVVPGQPIFSISYDTILQGGASLSGSLNKSTNDELIAQTSQGLSRRNEIIQTIAETREKIADQAQSIDRTKQGLEIQAQRVGLLQQNVAAVEGLREKQFISEFEYRSRQDELLNAKQALLQMQRSIEQSQSQIVQLTAELGQQREQVAEVNASNKASQATLEEKRVNNLAGEESLVTVSTGGVATSIEVRQGNEVAPNQVLALVVPEGTKESLEVDLWVPSRSIGFVEKGNEVRLMFDAFPYQTFGVGSGRVADVSAAPILPTEIPVPIDTKEQMYKVVVRLDKKSLNAYGRSWELKSGMRLSADLILDKKSLLDWMLDPIMAVRRRNAS